MKAGVLPSQHFWDPKPAKNDFTQFSQSPGLCFSAKKIVIRNVSLIDMEIWAPILIFAIAIRSRNDKFAYSAIVRTHVLFNYLKRDF